MSRPQYRSHIPCKKASLRIPQGMVEVALVQLHSKRLRFVCRTLLGAAHLLQIVLNCNSTRAIKNNILCGTLVADYFAVDTLAQRYYKVGFN